MAGLERMDSVCEVTIIHQLACDARPRARDGTLDQDPSSQPRDCREACPARQAVLHPVPSHVTRRCHIPKWLKCPYGHSCCWATVSHDAYGSSGCTCKRAYEARHFYVEKPLSGMRHITWFPLTASSEAAHASTPDVSDDRSPLARYLASEVLSGLTATSAAPRTSVESNSFPSAATPFTPETTAASNSSLNGATPVTPETAVMSEDGDLSQTAFSSPAMRSMVVTPSTAATPSAGGTPVTESLARVGLWPGWVTASGVRPPPGFITEDFVDKDL
ncbi:hypothetical protein SMACR_03283 [Sordaria macrospora]|uniref:WGS project CABT00000000 data, contig 2.10 n=2 Tax=Sordaria macrospora TaxID=5147 RepID=F7VWF7_SORMK|nr:uncharacterized protein SMAC_03283 [Sordaria macrospora k-hell]KAA8635654.1 hypothetical protein SMACR_03283 [Sordaria macrospora]KAH7630080.1 hypothetical protein B0T09DRAFT_141822 [Sordaria sp. MPI-SDFR-AT-0083]WPJ66760.1 hypothetical protein SMAC4_03283 [Sordaria macrospora]CCC09725.1 unnamed protein product [Sordaria macrospora k-hell]